MGGCCLKAICRIIRTQRQSEQCQRDEECPVDSQNYRVQNTGTCSPRHLSPSKSRPAYYGSQSSDGATQGERKPVSLIHINTANYHELCVIEQISIEQAQEIIRHRILHGPFLNREQILRVPGISHRKLECIWPRISLAKKERCVRSTIRRSKPRKRHHSQPLLHSVATNFTQNTGVMLMFGEQESPNISPKFHKDLRSVRIATWNLQCFSQQKVANSGVLEVVCLTLLMHGLDLVVFQELSDVTALKKVCEQLNNPTLPKVKSWPNQRSKWMCQISPATGRMFQGYEYQGFIWNESSGIQSSTSGLLGKTKVDDFVRRPFIGAFKVGCWELLLVSVHLKAAGWSGIHLSKVQAEVQLLAPLIQAISETITGKHDIIVLGDFNLGPDDNSFQQLKCLHYLPLLDDNVPTNISPVNPSGTCSYDNIWISNTTYSSRYTGRCGVIRRGLQHPLIVGKKPHLSGTVSDHCPVWATFNYS